MLIADLVFGVLRQHFHPQGYVSWFYQTNNIKEDVGGREGSVEKSSNTAILKINSVCQYALITLPTRVIQATWYLALLP